MDYRFLQLPSLTVDTKIFKSLLDYSANKEQYDAHCLVLDTLGQPLPTIQYTDAETQEIDYPATIKLIDYDAVINGKLYYKPSFNNYLSEHYTFTKYLMPNNVIVTEKVECKAAPVDEAKYYPIEPQAPGISESVFLKTLAIVTGKATNLNLGDM